MTELTRRDLLERGAAAAGALAVAGVPSARAAAGTFDGAIRLATLGYDLPGSVQSRAEPEEPFSRRTLRLPDSSTTPLLIGSEPELGCEL